MPIQAHFPIEFGLLGDVIVREVYFLLNLTSLSLTKLFDLEILNIEIMSCTSGILQTLLSYRVSCQKWLNTLSTLESNESFKE